MNGDSELYAAQLQIAADCLEEARDLITTAMMAQRTAKLIAAGIALSRLNSPVKSCHSSCPRGQQSQGQTSQEPGRNYPTPASESPEDLRRQVADLLSNAPGKAEAVEAQLYGGKFDGLSVWVHTHKGAIPDKIIFAETVYHADKTAVITRHSGKVVGHCPRYSLATRRAA